VSRVLAQGIGPAWLGLSTMVLVMGGVWLLSRRLRNAGIVDVAWSLNFTILAALFAILGTGDPGRRLAVALAVAVWSLRLGLHLWARVAREHPKEDGRYATLRERWGRSAEWRMFGFFQLQGVLNVLLATPFLLACLDPRPLGRLADQLGLALLALAVVGETAADRQLERFKADPANHGEVCRVGLWSWSRHPNYFFEWLAWCAWAVIAWPAPAGPAALVSPALMLYFLLRVTGIPATEVHALRSRGDAYRRYQREVSPFVPWPRRTP
jgi:steroid 5-alpha reductase family enzyme